MLWTHIDIVFEKSAHGPCIAFHDVLCYDFVMHRHITYYTQSIVCQSGFYKGIFSNKFLSSTPWAYSGFAKGGGELFEGLVELHAAKRLVTRGIARRLLGGIFF